MKKQKVEPKKTTSKRKSPKAKKLACVDLFCGCGGMSLGFEKAGFDVKAGFELWEPAINVYKANFKHPIIKQDLSRLDEAIPKIAEYKPDLIVGGPPCQDFSTAGHQDESLGRAILSVYYSQIVSAIRPKYFVMENVANIRNSKAFKEVIGNFKSAGYGLTLRILDAAYCGVPQTRKRMFVVGALGAKDDFLGARLDNGLAKQPMTIHDYLRDKLGTEYYFRVPTNYTRRGVFSIYEPSMTIRAVDRPIPSGYKGNANDSAPLHMARCLTPKERSYIQTFPESFKFDGSKTHLQTMIGNAVPVNLARYVGKALMCYIKTTQARDSHACR